MTERYETTRSRGDAALKLIFAEGTWDTLPFEVRLSRPWYGGEVCGRTGITTHQRSEVARRGYCIEAVQPYETEKLSIGNFKARSATSPLLIPILGTVVAVAPTRSESGVHGDEELTSYRAEQSA